MESELINTWQIAKRGHSHQSSDKENIVIRTAEQIQALKDAKDALPCYLGTTHLFTEVENKEGTGTMPAACAVGFLMQQAEDCDVGLYTDEPEPHETDWTVLLNTYGVRAGDLYIMMEENDTIKGSSYEAAHKRCIQLKNTLGRLISASS